MLTVFNGPLDFLVSYLRMWGPLPLCYDTSRVGIPYQLGRMTLLCWMKSFSFDESKNVKNLSVKIKCTINVMNAHLNFYNIWLA